MTQPTISERNALRRREGALIDPETAHVFWEWRYLDDPYWLGLHPKNEPNDNIGRVHFAAQPDSKIVVEFGDLPEATVGRLRERMKAGDPTLSPDDDDFIF